MSVIRDKSGYNLRRRSKMVPQNSHQKHSPTELNNIPKEVFETQQSHVDCVDSNNIDNQATFSNNGGSEEDNDRVPLISSDVEAVDALRSQKDDDSKIREETSLSIALQVFLPYIIAGFGTVAAGVVLDKVQHWQVFDKVPEVFILVPSLLGLKGNLEMTLASRLSTQANLGKMDTSKERFLLVGGNLALTQAQAIVVGFLASLTAVIFGWIPEGKFDIHHVLLLCASSVLTASLASLALGLIMVLVIILSRKCNINPDNVATPIAASLGDLVTLSLLSAISNVLYQALGKQVWLAPTIIVFFIILVPLWVVISMKNKYTCEVIYTGWVPVISAMMISSCGGLILDFAVKTYKGIAVFSPVINDVNARVARVLMAMVIPGHLVFMYTISFINAGHTTESFIFAVFYLTASVLQVIVLLFVADWMVHYMWKIGDDPDNFAIPYLTAIGDLLGTALLALAFHLLYLIGDGDLDVGD